MKLAAASPTVVARMQKRLETQQARIDQGVAAGTLTKKETGKLQPRLDAMKNLVGDGFEANAQRGFKAVLDDLGSDIKQQKHDQQIAPGRHLKNIAQRLEAGAADGSLNAKEQGRLGAKVQTLTKALDAATTPEARAKVADQISTLSKHVFTQRHDRQFDQEKRFDSFVGRIEAGVADGSLTANEVTRLSLRTAKLASGDPGARGVNALNKAIARQRHDGQSVSEE